MTTVVPRPTCWKSHSASGMCMRMQPCDSEYPIDASFGVPWMPTPAAFSPIQRVPSGLPGPGGIGRAPTAHGDGGGVHHGFSCLSTICHTPDGVGYADCPVATWNVRTRRLVS